MRSASVCEVGTQTTSLPSWKTEGWYSAGVAVAGCCASAPAPARHTARANAVLRRSRTTFIELVLSFREEWGFWQNAIVGHLRQTDWQHRMGESARRKRNICRAAQPHFNIGGNHGHFDEE